MKTINNLLAFLDGKKTYIIAALTVIIGILQGNTPLTLQGLLAAALRSGIAKAE